MPKQRNVLVTGASTGIGRAIACYLVARDFCVFAGVRQPSDYDAMRRDAPALVPVMLEITDSLSVNHACAEITRQVGDGGLYALVNNAGVAIAGPLEYLPLDHLRYQFNVNVIGQMAVTQAFLPLIRQGQGRIVNMSSVNGKISIPLLGPYAASKFALEALSDALRVELRRWQIHVILIEPGSIQTPIWQKALTMTRTIEDSLPAQAKARYTPLYEAMYRMIGSAGNTHTSVDVVASIVHQALLARHPKTRYIVGADARLALFLSQFLPNRLRDTLFIKRMGLDQASGD